MKKLVCLLLALIMVLPVAVIGVSANTESKSTTKDYDLSTFKIVYTGAHLKDVAESFQADILKETGVTLEIITGDTANSGNEFIIGKADRDICKKAFAFAEFEYSDHVGIYCEGGKVQFIGFDRMTIKDSIKYFFKNVKTDKTTTVSLPENGAISKQVDPTSVDIPTKGKDSYIRIVTNNILMYYYSDQWNRPVTEDRLSLLIGFYNYLDADIVGFQECDALWNTQHFLDNEMKALGYSKAKTTNASNAPIYYKTDRFTELAAGGATYDTSSLSGYYEPRAYGWVCLEEVGTGKQVIVANTHFVWGWNDISGSSQMAIDFRNLSAKQLVEFTEKKKTEYPNAVSVVMGDLNSYLDSEACSILAAGLNAARDTAESTSNMKYDSDMNIGTKPPRSNSPKVIDHIYYSKEGATAKYYEVVVSKYSYSYSDHVPVLVDLVVGEEEEETTEEVTTEEITTSAPVTEAPATEAATTEAPATEAPTTEAPATEAPTTEAPATEAPATEAPATEAPAADDANGGCGGTVAMAGVALVAALGTCTAFVAKKKEN